MLLNKGYTPSSSSVFTEFFAPALAAYADSSKKYDCPELSDRDFLEMGVQRCLSESNTGRDFLQKHGDNGRKKVLVDLLFKSLKSERRLENLRSVNSFVASIMKVECNDPLAGIEELENFAVYAGDGHYHKGAAHDPKRLSSDGVMTKLAVGHFFLLDLRTHYLSHLTLGEQNATRKCEHDMHALKRSDIELLRCGAPKGRKVIIAWDKAGIDFSFWHKVKQSAGVYFISPQKENMKLICCGNRPFEQEDPRNAGVVSDEQVGPGGGGAMLRRITYLDPVDKVTYVLLTTEMTLPPAIIVLIYRHRWDIEKTFDELESKLEEGKAWASSPTAKTIHAIFLCMTHNLMVLIEELIRTAEKVDNDNERARREDRRKKAQEKGGNYIATVLQRFTVRSLKFIRWLRNFVYQQAPWADAIARLREIYATF